MHARHAALSGALLLTMAAAAWPADVVVGALTVKGKITPLKYVAGSIQRDAADQAYLVLLLSDVPVAEDDRTPSRLASLAAAGQVHAVRVVWQEGFDFVRAAPYHQALSQSGRVGLEHPTINLNRYDEHRFEGWVKSKMLGQDWFFEAQIKTALARGGTFQLEPEADEEPVAGGAPDETTAKKRALGKLGYAFTVEFFEHAVQEASVEAVQLFLQAGMSPNTPGAPDRQPLILAVDECAYKKEANATQIARLLLDAGAKVDGTARNGITPLLSAAHYCENPEMIWMLVKAGANVNTRAPGGATPLMLAKVFKRTAIEAILRQAGAQE